MSQDEFRSKYVSGSRPLVVRGAAKHWKALEHFSFDFFRNLYLKKVGANNIDNSNAECNYFKYNTKFESLAEALQMPESMANGSSGETWWAGDSHVDWLCGTNATPQPFSFFLFSSPLSPGTLAGATAPIRW